MEIKQVIIRTSITVLFLTALLFTVRFCSRSISDVRKSFAGDGNITRYEFAPERPFTMLKVEGNVNVFIRQANTYNIIIEADSNLLPYLVPEYKEEQITFRHQGKLQFTTPVRLLISVPDLEKITLEGAVQLHIPDTIRTNRLVLELHGACKADLNVDLHHFSGVLSGAGQMELRGRASSSTLTLNGAARLRACDFMVAHNTVEVNGAGKACVYAHETLSATINGTGLIEYKGDPTVTPTINGIGKIRPARP